MFRNILAFSGKTKKLESLARSRETLFFEHNLNFSNFLVADLRGTNIVLREAPHGKFLVDAF